MSTNTQPTPAMNHVFVDYENVHEVDASILGAKSVTLTLLLGARQTKLDAELVEKLMAHASSIQLIRLTTSGKNALDFALAYYVGRAVITDPTAYFHIISRDQGFDPLIEHLKSRHLRARRHDDFSTLTFSHPPKSPPAEPKATPPTPVDPLITLALERLRKALTNRPKKQKTLLSHLKSILGKDATEAEAAKLLEKFRKAGHLTIDDKDAVTYKV